MYFEEYCEKIKYSFLHSKGPFHDEKGLPNVDQMLERFLLITSSENTDFDQWEKMILQPIYHRVHCIDESIHFAHFLPSESRVWTYSSSPAQLNWLAYVGSKAYMITTEYAFSSFGPLFVSNKYSIEKSSQEENSELYKLYSFYTLALAYYALNIARNGTLRCMKYLNERKTFGILLFDHPVVLDSMVTAVNEIEGSLLYLHDLTYKIEHQSVVKPIGELYRDCSYACQSAVTALDQVSVLMGARGYSQEENYSDWTVTLNQINAFMDQMAKAYQDIECLEGGC